MFKVTVIGTFYGTWPVWFPAFLLSCQMNPNIDWLFFTDCPIPDQVSPNIKFFPNTLEDFNQMASERLGLLVQKNSYSQVDLRPAYGVLFESHLKGVDFWGHCDFDVVWGNIRAFMPDALLEKYQILSSRKNRLAGHFTLRKNAPEINRLFEYASGYRQAFMEPGYTRFDEKGILEPINSILAGGRDSWLKVFWPEILVADWPELEKKAKGWYWEDGRLYNSRGCERIYIHFMTWKKSMKRIDFQTGDLPHRFTITRRGIWSQQSPWIERLIEATQLSVLQRTQPIHTRRSGSR